jgi:hypothetical protein
LRAHFGEYGLDFVGLGIPLAGAVLFLIIS